MATKTTKAAPKTKVTEPKITVDEVTQEMNENLTLVKNTVNSINTFALETADDVLNATAKGNKQWQKTLTKGIDVSAQVMTAQQELVFTALETAKKQFTDGANRFKKLFEVA